MEVKEIETIPPVIAIISGKPLERLPDDLFIPPDALEILLDSFTGPLDLLLYLIRRQNIDILDIPIALITEQYMQYIHLLEAHRLELAADYLVMAAVLAEIKSRLLLPPKASLTDEPEEDPRLVLVRKLQAYEQIKQAALYLDEIPRLERDNFRISLFSNGVELTVQHPDVTLSCFVDAMKALIKRQGHEIHHQISKEPLSVRERMIQILERLEIEKRMLLTDLIILKEGRMGLAVTLLAVLELARESMLIIMQINAYAPIHIQAIPSTAEVKNASCGDWRATCHLEHSEALTSDTLEEVYE